MTQRDIKKWKEYQVNNVQWVMERLSSSIVRLSGVSSSWWLESWNVFNLVYLVLDLTWDDHRSKLVVEKKIWRNQSHNSRVATNNTSTNWAYSLGGGWNLLGRDSLLELRAGRQRSYKESFKDQILRAWQTNINNL